MHDGVTWLVLHGDPHDPQFDESLRVFDSHPSVALLLLQSENPLRHGPEHTPPEHKGVTLLLEHASEQAPQLSAITPRRIHRSIAQQYEPSSARTALANKTQHTY